MSISIRRVVLASLFSFSFVSGSFMILPALAQDTSNKPASPSDSFELPPTDDGIEGSGPIRRYDWFRNLWKQRRSQWNKQKERDQGALVFFGDSITQGWGDNFKGEFETAKLANRGISGDTTRGMLLRLNEDVLSLNPSGIVMLMGTNDLEEKAEPETIASNVALIIQKVHQHNPKTPVVLCLVFPASESKARPASKIREINRLLEARVKDDEKVTVVDTWSLFANDKGDAKPEEFPDLLHPNDIAYRKWAQTLRPVLEANKLIAPTTPSKE
ncbi:GDSL-like Lipase/Acylhydrolase [Pirellula sp. SH-Sr6A]|uniref:SGNH/GDSL hydrolase family protein n=1 Tax=Pirellula sp. SH-Sr6A TaxID=1632865 RepID=UPI00078C3129|nr:SGNH/GDSL hydrolase family protein [Pirellula sp. SH-Sr6A]AMV34792.1 GDSL-like Lipase/Acylhydrolase [Pirellula sp. SH-Sr6A]